MKWFLLIIIVLAVAGLLYARMRPTSRTEAPTGGQSAEEAVSPPAVPEAGADSPGGASSFFPGSESLAGTADPGSDFASEPEISDEPTSESDADPSDGSGRTGL